MQLSGAIWSCKDLYRLYNIYIDIRSLRLRRLGFSGVETQSKMEQLMLTSERNRIMRLELLMGMGTSSLAVSTVIAGFFGRSDGGDFSSTYERHKIES